jgi:hypothetical protein
LKIRPTATQIAIAMQMLSVCRYFPAEEIPRAVIVKLLGNMVGDVNELDWLVSEMINQVGEWRGPVELRRLFLQRYAAADGVDPDAGFPDLQLTSSRPAGLITAADEIDPEFKKFMRDKFPPQQ